MKVLLIWHEVSESWIKLYLIRNPSDEDISILNEANGIYINGGEEEDTECPVVMVMDRISDNRNYCVHEDDPNNCIWSDRLLNVYKDKKIPVLNESINRVYICGII
jgi:hypothetical protein